LPFAKLLREQVPATLFGRFHSASVAFYQVCENDLAPCNQEDTSSRTFEVLNFQLVFAKNVSNNQHNVF
jgi:hypothetical protein